jgi:hypothetical protein
VQLIWWLGIVVVFIGALLGGAFIMETIRPAWLKRLHAMERGRQAQENDHVVP